MIFLKKDLRVFKNIPWNVHEFAYFFLNVQYLGAKIHAAVSQICFVTFVFKFYRKCKLLKFSTDKNISGDNFSPIFFFHIHTNPLRNFWTSKQQNQAWLCFSLRSNQTKSHPNTRCNPHSTRLNQRNASTWPFKANFKHISTRVCTNQKLCAANTAERGRWRLNPEASRLT